MKAELMRAYLEPNGEPMNEMMQTAEASTIIEQVIAKGDLSKLSAEQRNTYYNEVCKSLGLNPLTQPFAYIQLQGKLVLYARRDCCDQLRKLRGISIEIVSQKAADNLLTVHARADDKDGRKDEDYGVVAFPNTLQGEHRANAIMRAVTKAKRRVTLSICGLGWLDETEIADTPREPRKPQAPGANVITYDPDAIPATTDKLSPDDAPAATSTEYAAGADNPEQTESERIATIDRALTEATKGGTDELQRVWETLPNDDRATFEAAKERRFKPMAAKADAEKRGRAT